MQLTYSNYINAGNKYSKFYKTAANEIMGRFLISSTGITHNYIWEGKKGEREKRKKRKNEREVEKEGGGNILNNQT